MTNNSSLSPVSSTAPPEEETFPADEVVIQLTLNDLMIIMMTTVALIGLFTGIWASSVIQKNKHFEGIVKHYVLFDVINLTTISVMHLVWGVPCALWTLNEMAPLLDYFLSGVVFFSLSMTFPAKICLSTNRFLAVAFDSRYYRHFDKYKNFQYVAIILYPSAISIPFFVPGCHPIFLPYGLNIFYMEEGECGRIHVMITQVIVCYSVLFSVAFLDVATFLLIRTKLRKFEHSIGVSNEQQKKNLRKDLKLASQMLTNLFLGAFVTVSFSAGEYILKSDFQTFLLFTSFWQTFCAIKCFTYVIFLRPSASKSVESSQPTISVAAARSKMTSKHNSTNNSAQTSAR